MPGKRAVVMWVQQLSLVTNAGSRVGCGIQGALGGKDRSPRDKQSRGGAFCILSLLSISWANFGHGKAISNNVSVEQLSPDDDNRGSNSLFCQTHAPYKHRAK